MDIQRNELTIGFEEAMRKREHEYRIQADEMSTKVLAHELKVIIDILTSSPLAWMNVLKPELSFFS